MFGDGALTFREFIMREPLPLATIQDALLEFLGDIREGLGYRIYQVQKPKNRHLVDIRPVEELPPSKRVKGILVVTPPELIAGKVMAWVRRRTKPKSGTDWRDIASLLLKFPDLKKQDGEVNQRLRAAGASAEVLAAWKELIAQDISPEDEDEEFAK